MDEMIDKLPKKSRLKIMAPYGLVLAFAAASGYEYSRLKEDFAPFENYPHAGLVHQGQGNYICRSQMQVKLSRPEEAKVFAELALLKNSQGKDFFSCEELRKYTFLNNFSASCAQEFVSFKDQGGNNPFYGAQISQLCYLELNPQEAANFTDTEKPNALVIYPTSDVTFNNGRVESATAGFSDPDEKKKFWYLKWAYDVKVMVASKEKEVHDAIDEKLNFELFYLGGHGEMDSLALGGNIESKSCCFQKDDEDYFIDTSDSELETYLHKLSADAVIFLNSCGNGRGGKSSFNLANYFFAASGGKTIISSTGEFKSTDIKVNSIYPFDANIVVNGIDQTYVPDDDNLVSCIKKGGDLNYSYFQCISNNFFPD